MKPTAKSKLRPLSSQQLSQVAGGLGNGATLPNGATLANGLSSINGLNAVNGLSAING